jgi:hypothetical protein
MKIRLFKVIVLSLAILLATTSSVLAKNGPPSPPEEPTGINNLSVPVIFAEGIGAKGGLIADSTDVANTGLPRGFAYPDTINMLDEFAAICSIDLTGDKIYDLIDTKVWLQKTETQWQAEFALGVQGNAVPVDLDWGDNLTSVKYYTNSIIRMENVMFHNGSSGLYGYEMGWVEGQGVDEVWGTTGVIVPSMQATVFSQNARLTIQKLENGVPTGPVIFDKAIYEGYALPDSDTNKYSGEINVGGKLIYGHVFRCRDYGMVAGMYRITFSIDKMGTDFNGNVAQGNISFLSSMDSGARIITGEELQNNYPNSVAVSYIDITIYPAKGGRR